MLNSVEEECSKIDLEINTKKTKSTIFNSTAEDITSTLGNLVKQTITKDTGQ